MEAPRFLEKEKRGGLARHHHGIDGRVRRDGGLEFAGRGGDGKVEVCRQSVQGLKRVSFYEVVKRRAAPPRSFSPAAKKEACNGSLELW